MDKSEKNDCVKKAKLHVLSHMHWDREWYQEFQGYRQRLVYQLDSLLDLLETQPDYRCFHFDGQTACLLDYLEIRPENKGRIEKHIKDGRIAIGPWFVMPDELLLSGESLIRNLMLGHKLCGAFGAEPMPVGYVTDIFGHCSQLPQILRSFGIDCAFLHRGTCGEDENSEMLWESPDGSKIFIIKVYQFTGYNDFLCFKWGVTEENLLSYSGEYENNKLKLAATDVLFALDGADHTAPRWDIPEEINRLNGAFKKIECVHSSFFDYYGELKSAMGENWQNNLKKSYKGELRTPSKSGMWNELMNGAGSSRLPLKQANDEMEMLLPRYAEPLHAWARVSGGDDQKAFLDLAWEYLLLNHPHDSIVGCSIDQVHKDMVYRFDQAKSLARNSITESIQAICKNIDLACMGSCARAVNVFNMSGFAAGPVVRFSFELPQAEADDMESKGLQPVLIDSCGVPVNYRLLKVEKNVRTEFFTSKINTPSPAYSVTHNILIHRYHVQAEADIPPLSRKAFGIKYAPESESGRVGRLCPVSADKSGAMMENGHIRVNIHKDGRIDLRDLETGVLYSGLLYYENCGDTGEGWNHFYPENDEKILSTDKGKWEVAEIELIGNNSLSASFKISGTLRVPEGLDETGKSRSRDIAGINIDTVLTLTAGDKKLSCKTVINNKSRCHRMRVMFPTGQSDSEVWFADTAFDVVSRDIKAIDTMGWKEQARPESPIKNFAGVRGDTGGLAVITKGLCEACVQEDMPGTLALTLFRGFCENLLEEKTNDSQLLGELTVEYSILPLPGGTNDIGAELFAETERRKYPLPAYTMPVQSGSSKPENQFINVGSPFVVSTIKTAENGINGIVVRFFNPLVNETSAAVRAGFVYQEVWETDSLESKIKKIGSSDGVQLEITLRGKQICTLMFIGL